MNGTLSLRAPGVSNRALRPFLGAVVIVRTFAATWRGTLLSCVKDSAWFVVDDSDVVLHLDEILSVHPDRQRPTEREAVA